MKFLINTLGCKVNTYESNVIRDIFLNEGYEESIKSDYLGEDQFFKNNYDNRFMTTSTMYNFN